MQKKLYKMMLVAPFAALISVCSFISIPSPIPFSLQTFAIFAALFILGGKLGFLSIIVYISLGIVGLPVFSGFGSGIGYIMGASGGFIIGFLVTGGAFWALEGIFGKGKRRLVYAAICQILMYLCGAAWFAFVFGGADSFLSALALCTLPYLLPDAIKILLSSIISTRLEKVINM